MRQKFYYCDARHLGKTPCVFTEHSMQRIWKRSGGDIARCPRHGQLICNEAEAEDKKELHEQIDPE